MSFSNLPCRVDTSGGCYTRSYQDLDVTIYPRQYTADAAFKISSLIITAFEEEVDAMGWLARDEAGYKFLTVKEFADVKHPLWSINIRAGGLKGRLTKKSHDKCSSFGCENTISPETNRYICTSEVGNCFSYCLLDLVETYLQDYALTQRNEISTAFRDGRKATPVYTSDVIESRIVDEIIEKFVFDTKVSLDKTIAYGDIFSNDTNLTGFDGLFKQLYHAGKNGVSYHTVDYKVKGTMNASHSFFIKTGTKTIEVPFNTDLETTYGDLINQLNALTFGSDVYPVMAEYVFDNSSAIIGVRVSSTVEGENIPVELGIGYSSDDDGFSCDDPCELRLYQRVVSAASIGSRPVCIDYDPELSEATAFEYFEKIMKKVHIDEQLRAKKSMLQLHVSPELAQILRYSRRFSLPGGVAPMGPMSLEDIAALFGIEGIYEKPQLSGKAFLMTYPENIVFGINNRLDQAYNNFRIEVAGVGATDCNGRDMRDHIVIDWKAYMGVGFIHFRHVVTNICGGCYDGSHFGELDPQCTGGPVHGECGTVSTKSC